MFAKHKAAKAAEEAGLLRAELSRMLAVAQGREHPATSIVLKGGEECIHVITGAGLFETRRGPGHWEGRSSGISVPVGGGVRIRTGASRGHYVQGAEAPTIIDTGTVTMTSKRVVFTGPRYTREWDFGRLVGVEHFEHQPWTAIQVSNRQKTSGFTYNGLRLDFVHTWLNIAMAINQGERAQVVEQLQSQLAAVAPAAPLPPAPETPEKAALSPAPPAAAPDAVAAAESPGPGSEAAPKAGATAAETADSGATPLPIPAGGSPATDPGADGLGAAPLGPVQTGPALPPPNWYPDPARLAALRWWDGSQWTSYTAGPAPGGPAAGRERPGPR